MGNEAIIRGSLSNYNIPNLYRFESFLADGGMGSALLARLDLNQGAAVRKAFRSGFVKGAVASEAQKFASKPEEAEKFRRKYGTAFTPEFRTKWLTDRIPDLETITRDEERAGILQMFAPGQMSNGEILQTPTKRTVIKIPKKGIISNKTALKRFAQEWMIQAQFYDENLVTALDAGIGNLHLERYENGKWVSNDEVECPYISLQYVPNCLSIEDIVTKCSREEQMDIAIKAAKGLLQYHARGVVHRDIKPANIFVTRNARGELIVKVGDPGIAKVTSSEEDLTMTGNIIGTPRYMAAEQAISSKHVDGRADITSLVLTLYKFFTGKDPYAEYGNNVNKMLIDKINGKVPSLNTGNKILDDVFVVGLAGNPAKRYQNLGELIKVLEEVQNGRNETLTQIMVDRKNLSPVLPNELRPQEYRDEVVVTEKTSHTKNIDTPRRRTGRYAPTERQKKKGIGAYVGGAIAAGIITIAGIGYALSGGHSEKPKPVTQQPAQPISKPLQEVPVGIKQDIDLVEKIKEFAKKSNIPGDAVILNFNEFYEVASNKENINKYLGSSFNFKIDPDTHHLILSAPLIIDSLDDKYYVGIKLRHYYPIDEQNFNSIFGVGVSQSDSTYPIYSTHFLKNGAYNSVMNAPYEDKTLKDFDYIFQAKLNVNGFHNFIIAHDLDHQSVDRQIVYFDNSQILSQEWFHDINGKSKLLLFDDIKEQSGQINEISQIVIAGVKKDDAPQQFVQTTPIAKKAETDLEKLVKDTAKGYGLNDIKVINYNSIEIDLSNDLMKKMYVSSSDAKTDTESGHLLIGNLQIRRLLGKKYVVGVTILQNPPEDINIDTFKFLDVKLFPSSNYPEYDLHLSTDKTYFASRIRSVSDVLHAKPREYQNLQFIDFDFGKPHDILFVRGPHPADGADCFMIYSNNAMVLSETWFDGIGNYINLKLSGERLEVKQVVIAGLDENVNDK